MHQLLYPILVIVALSSATAAVDTVADLPSCGVSPYVRYSVSIPTLLICHGSKHVSLKLQKFRAAVFLIKLVSATASNSLTRSIFVRQPIAPLPIKHVSGPLYDDVSHEKDNSDIWPRRSHLSGIAKYLCCCWGSPVCCYCERHGTKIFH